jgi:hypothetical protein
MKGYLTVLLVIPSILAAQQQVAFSPPVTMEIRSVDSTRASEVSIGVEGGLFGSLGVLRPAPGRVHCGPSGCTATTPAVLELTESLGKGRVSVSTASPELQVTVIQAGRPERRIVAFGHTVSFTRDSTGQLVITAPRMVTRF